MSLSPPFSSCRPPPPDKFDFFSFIRFKHITIICKSNAVKFILFKTSLPVPDGGINVKLVNVPIYIYF